MKDFLEFIIMTSISKKIIPKIIRKPINKFYYRKKIDFRLFLYYRILSKIKIFGNIMYLKKPSFVSRNLARFGIHEELETNYVIQFLKNDQIALDIGANIGYYTLLFAKLVGPKGFVIAFEPEKSNYETLRKNVYANQYYNVKLEKMGLGNKTEKTSLLLSKTNTGEHRIVNSTSSTNAQHQEIEIMKLDDYLESRKIKEKISFIKIDVEGFELHVINGMKKLLERNDDLKIIVEFTPFAIREAYSLPRKLLEFLHSFNFKINFFDYQSRTIKRVDDIELFLQKYDTKDGKWGDAPSVNLLCEKSVN